MSTSSIVGGATAKSRNMRVGQQKEDMTNEIIDGGGHVITSHYQEKLALFDKE
jgi:hypothetical protein